MMRQTASHARPFIGLRLTTVDAVSDVCYIRPSSYRYRMAMGPCAVLTWHRV